MIDNFKSGMSPTQLDLLKRLLAVRTWTFHEEAMVSFLVDHVKNRGVARGGKLSVDEHKNVFIIKGNARFAPCVAAHTDTVHKWTKIQIVQQDGILFGVDEQGQRTGLGGDDKAGVFICLELLERSENLAVALFAAEEAAGAGAYRAEPEFFRKVGCVIEFDCPGGGMFSHSAGGEQLFANRGEFIQTLLPVLVERGLTNWQRHPLTDATALRKRFDLSCLNLSAGYRNWHRRDEFVVLEEVEAAIGTGQALLQALGCRRYPFPAGARDADPPPFEVTGLKVPNHTAYESHCVH